MADESPSQITIEVEVLPGDSVGFTMSGGSTPTYTWGPCNDVMSGIHVSTTKDFG